MARLETPLTEVVGPKTAKALESVLELRTAGDLLHHYPRRLAERGELTELSKLTEGDDVTVMAEVRRTEVKMTRGNPRQKRLEVEVGDGRGTLRLTFFGNRQVWRERDLVPGVRGLFAGKVGIFNKSWQLTHPQYVILGESADQAADWVGELIPIYPAGREIQTWDISRAVQTVLDTLDLDGDPLPAEVRARVGLIGLEPALRQIHRPASRAEWGAARKRLAWDEAFGLQLVLAQRRSFAANDPASVREPRPDGMLAEFDRRLPFTLTSGQVEVGRTIAHDLAQPHPMHRLLQGEVGSGKTVVALRAMLQVVDAGGQAALLAPTEVLAAQHARTIDSLLGDLARGGQLGGAETATRVALLTGSLNAKARREALLEAAGGAAGIVIGTHALIQDQVSFADLGLVVVDEQHRFGVEQRDALRAKGARPPHLLVMTATPIPRTVAMTVFGDLETSTLAELPAGRSPISTTVVPVGEKPAWLDRAWARVREEVAAGRQAYVVCPRIGDGVSESEGPDGPDGVEAEDESAARRPPLAVADVFAELESGALAGLRLACLHGRMPVDEREAVMRGFADGSVDVLVATTVVEVGVDVPNATAMVLLDAERFGISQLHQLRGRVGRGRHPGICLLVTESPPGTVARERLDAVAATTDGFELAEVDVQQRREGDILGVAQSGRRSRLKLLSLLRDADLIGEARQEAGGVIDADPTLAKHPLLAAQLAELVDDSRTEYLEKA